MRPQNKKCGDCLETKSIRNFTKRRNYNGTKTQYYCSFCKKCMTIRSIKYHKKNHAKYLAYLRKYNYDKYHKDIEASRLLRRQQYRIRKMKNEKST